jgi:hypothetical protein
MGSCVHGPPDRDAYGLTAERIWLRMPVLRQDLSVQGIAFEGESKYKIADIQGTNEYWSNRS